MGEGVKIKFVNLLSYLIIDCFINDIVPPVCTTEICKNMYELTKKKEYFCNRQSRDFESVRFNTKNKNTTFILKEMYLFEIQIETCQQREEYGISDHKM